MKIINKRDGSILYNSSNESINSEDLNSKAYDRDIFESLLNLIPDNFRNYNNYFGTLSDISAYIISKEINNIKDINNIYNPDLGSEAIVNFLANRYNIPFPINYDLNQKRFLLKYYPNFIKIKGTKLSLNILDFVNRNEKEFYDSFIYEEDRYKINRLSEGYSKITIENATDKKRLSAYQNFAQTLINRVTPAGMYSKLSF